MTVSRPEVMWAYVTEHGADLAHLWVRNGSRGLEVLDVLVDREAGIMPTDIVGDVHGVAFEEPALAFSTWVATRLRPSARLSRGSRKPSRDRTRKYARSASPSHRNEHARRGKAMPNTLRAPAHTITYELTPDGIRVAFFYTKVDDRLLSRCWPAIQLPRHSSFEVPFEPRIDPWTLTSRPHA
jgi:hypothetical protein